MASMFSSPPPEPCPNQSGWADAVLKAIAKLKEVNINFLAIDFDQTILDIHTGGRWHGTAAELSKHVRPLFRDLIAAAIAEGIYVAVVTFTPQTGFVAEVLERTFGEKGRQIPIRGNDRSWKFSGNGSSKGKQPHMASAVAELEGVYGADITKETTLLIDDDAKNIRVSLHEGVRAIWLNPEKSTRLLNDIGKLI
mmetsp:Transcript_13822/g.19339  ORF Transcript_13822/g.19339 Transcript_13822/m.19339 type:complete len:195 (-) Transcript_13822:1246-1830(-)